MSGWFKAGTRWHYADAGDRSLCITHESAGVELVENPGGRQCARCARALADLETERAQQAYRATLGPARKPVQRTLTDEEQQMVDSLKWAREQQQRREKAAGR